MVRGWINGFCHGITTIPPSGWKLYYGGLRYECQINNTFIKVVPLLEGVKEASYSVAFEITLMQSAMIQASYIKPVISSSLV